MIITKRKRATLKKISTTPFPQNFISEALRRDITADEVPSDFLAGLQIILPQIVKDGARGEKIIRLRYEQGLTLAEIGQEIGVNKERIRLTLHSIETKLLHHYHTFLCEGLAAWQAEVEAANTPLTAPEQVDIIFLMDLGASAREVTEMLKLEIHTLKDLQDAPDEKLLEANRIGRYHVEKLRKIQQKLEQQLQQGKLLPLE